MLILLPLNLVLIILFVLILGRFGWRRGLIAEIVTACGLLIDFVVYDLFVRYILIGGLDLILAIAGAIVGRLTNSSPNYNVDYDKLTTAWKFGLNIFAFVFLAIIAYFAGSQFVGNAGTAAKPSKSWAGTAMGAVNALILLATVFRVAGAPDLSRIDWRLTIPAVDVRFSGNRDNPFGNWLSWLPLVLGAVILLMIFNLLSKGFPSQKGMGRIMFIVVIAALVALVFTFGALGKS